METLLSICLGLGLSAACGFRIFIPLLAVSIASLSGHMTLSHGLEWIGTYPAFLAFAAAAAFEVAAYYIPWFDNLLDAIAGPAAVVAGTLVAASGMLHMDPLLKWSLALIAGGGTAALFHSSTVVVRAASTALTGGIGNHAVATAELGIASVLSILALTLPLVGIAAALVLLVFLARKGFRRLLGSGKTGGADRL